MTERMSYDGAMAALKRALVFGVNPSLEGVTELVEELEERKYGWQKHLAQAITATMRLIRRQPTPEAVMLVITEDPPAKL
jgi:uncharacterized membrane protein HdeD (DUF308 family)